MTTNNTSYVLNDDGVYEVTRKRDSNGNQNMSKKYICSPLEITARTRNHAGHDWGILLRVKNQDNVWHEQAFPMEVLAAPQAYDLFGKLFSMGLILNDNDKSTRDALISYLFQTEETQGRALCVSKTGWHEHNFILPDKTYGQLSEPVVFQSLSTKQLNYHCSGTLKEWQDNIAQYAIGNSRLAFALSCGFAAPLLQMMDRENGGFHFRGSSSIGKSAIMNAAGSIWGGNKHKPQGYLQQWRLTDNALEGIAAAHNDTLLCLDEISQVDPVSASNTAYMLANGMGKSRATKQGSWRQPETWRVLFLSNGEISLSTKLSSSRSGLKATAGQEVRIIDIVADVEQSHGIYETLHSFENGAALSNHIKKASKAFYGTASREYIHFLAHNYDDVKQEALKIMESFNDSFLPPEADGQVRRCLDRFALVAAGGELAIKYGILRWPEKEAYKAAQICFESWLYHRGGTEALEIRNGINQVRGFLEEHGSSRFQKWVDLKDSANDTVYNRAGFSKLTAAGTEYYILPKVFTNEVCAGFESTVIAKAMAERGFLKPRKSGKLQYSVKLPGFGLATSCYLIKPQIFDNKE